MASGFQSGAFQQSAFQQGAPYATSTGWLKLPVNCVLLQDQPEPGDRTFDLHPMNKRDRVIATNGGDFSEGKPSFSSKTSSRGYD